MIFPAKAYCFVVPQLGDRWLREKLDGKKLTDVERDLVRLAVSRYLDLEPGNRVEHRVGTITTSELRDGRRASIQINGVDCFHILYRPLDAAEIDLVSDGRSECPFERVYAIESITRGSIWFEVDDE